MNFEFKQEPPAENPVDKKVEGQVSLFLEKHPDASPESIAKVRENWTKIIGFDSSSIDQTSQDIQESYAKREEAQAAEFRRAAERGRVALGQAATARERSRIADDIVGNEEIAIELESLAKQRRLIHKKS